MTNHLRRIREHMALETRALLLEAERARLFDHNGNRGTEAEHSILRWLRARFAPHYTVSSGEIIDSFDTPGDTKSRQQDGVVHRNDPDANRFLLPSGMRLVPIETVAAVVEVKLTLTKEEFQKADRASTETARLRYRVGHRSDIPDVGGQIFTPVGEAARESGLPLNDPRLKLLGPTFAVFAFGGVSEPETIAGWLKEASTISLVCCLEAGCIWRGSDSASVSGAEGALTRFAECLRGGLGCYDRLYAALRPSFGGYADVEALPYWDDTGYDWPASYRPTEEQVTARERLFERRPALRRRR